ncbi:MAG: hypothetical protein GY720_18205 [bacterium]|nr:hypothetical protein [bacterium]
MRNVFRVWLATSLLLSIATTPESAALPSGPAVVAAWESSNPGAGGAMSTVGAGPTGIVLVASDLSGVYRSVNKGGSWDLIGASRGLLDTHASGLGFDPINQDIMYVGTDGGVYRSRDRGLTFNQVIEGGYATDIEAAQAVPQRVYAAVMSDWNQANGVVYRSDDRGRSWTPTADLPAAVHILELFVDLSGERVYALAGDGRFVDSSERLYRSTDGGDTWERIAAGLGKPLSVRLGQSGTLWMSTGEDSTARLYKSDDWGDTFDLAANRTGIVWLPEPGTVRLIPLNDQFPWNDNNGVWESTDGGNTWDRIAAVEDFDGGWSSASWIFGGGFNGDVKTIGMDLSNPSRVYWANSQFVYKASGDPLAVAQTFTDEVGGGFRSNNLDNVVVYEASIPHAAGKVMYVGYWDLGCWVTRDHGESWSNCNDPNESGGWDGAGGNTTTILADPDRPRRVWAAHTEDRANALLQRSNNYGAPNSWVAASGLGRGSLFGLSLDPNSALHSRTLYVTRNGDVFQSTDDGLTWTKVFNCNSCRSTAVADDGTVYAAGATGVHKSTTGDSGTFTEITPDSVTTGPVWTKSVTGGFQGPVRVTVGEDSVFVTAHGSEGGVWRSDDGGSSWSQVLDEKWALDTAVDPSDPNHILVAGSSAYASGSYKASSPGVLETWDGGTTWQESNVGLGWPFAARVAFTRDGTRHIVLSPGGGFYWRPSVATGKSCNGQSATIVGTDRVDVLVATLGDDVVAALRGHDVVLGRKGDDLICGNKGRDGLRGGSDGDVTNGGRGNDICRAESTSNCED